MTSFPDWVRNHLPSVTTASMLTAASSMIIAGVSLYYTLEAQRIDLEYKEVSIRPRLAFALNNTEWDLVLTNYGLGPGLVVDAVVRYGEKCHHANSESNEDWSRSSSAFGDEIIANVYGKIIPPAFWTRTKGAIVSRIPTVGLTVRPGESFDLFTVLTDTIMIPKKLDIAELNRIKTEFSAKILAIPMNIRVCSMTQRFCEWSGPELSCP